MWPMEAWIWRVKKENNGMPFDLRSCLDAGDEDGKQQLPLDGRGHRIDVRQGEETTEQCAPFDEESWPSRGGGWGPSIQEEDHRRVLQISLSLAPLFTSLSRLWYPARVGFYWETRGLDKEVREISMEEEISPITQPFPINSSQNLWFSSHK